MGGKEAVKKLLEIDPNVKAIVASGYSNDPVLANFRAYGFSGVFAKQDKAEELGKVLHKVINGQQ
jgi:DNA-binding NarL/FixJ family response regulator